MRSYSTGERHFHEMHIGMDMRGSPHPAPGLDATLPVRISNAHASSSQRLSPCPKLMTTRLDATVRDDAFEGQAHPLLFFSQTIILQ